MYNAVMTDQEKGYEVIRGKGKIEPTLVEGVLKRLLRDENLTTKFFHKEPGELIDPHYHTENIAAYVLSGRLQIRIGKNLSETVEFFPGDALLMKKGTVHQEEMISDTPVETTTAFIKEYETVQV